MLAEAGESFDIVLAMEIVEHVADLRLFIHETARHGAPERAGGVLDYQPHAEEPGC